MKRRLCYLRFICIPEVLIMTKKRIKNLQGDTTFDGPFKSAQSSHSGYLTFFFILFPILSNLNQNEKKATSLTKLQMKNTNKRMILKNEKAHDDCAHCNEKIYLFKCTVKTFGHLVMNSVFSALVSPLHLYLTVQ